MFTYLSKYFSTSMEDLKGTWFFNFKDRGPECVLALSHTLISLGEKPTTLQDSIHLSIHPSTGCTAAFNISKAASDDPECFLSLPLMFLCAASTWGLSKCSFTKQTELQTSSCMEKITNSKDFRVIQIPICCLLTAAAF